MHPPLILAFRTVSLVSCVLGVSSRILGIRGEEVPSSHSQCLVKLSLRKQWEAFIIKVQKIHSKGLKRTFSFLVTGLFITAVSETLPGQSHWTWPPLFFCVIAIIRQGSKTHKAYLFKISRSF